MKERLSMEGTTSSDFGQRSNHYIPWFQLPEYHVEVMNRNQETVKLSYKVGYVANYLFCS